MRPPTLPPTLPWTPTSSPTLPWDAHFALDAHFASDAYVAANFAPAFSAFAAAARSYLARSRSLPRVQVRQRVTRRPPTIDSEEEEEPANISPEAAIFARKTASHFEQRR